MKGFVLRQRLWLAAFAAMLGTYTALACEGIECDHATHLPETVDLYVELNHATAEDWRFVSTLAGPASAIDDAWNELAAVLGIDQAQAFDRLLGTRVSLAMRGLWAEHSEWMALFTTDNETAGLIRERLGARPRKIVGGRSVLRLPGGQFQLTEIHHKSRVTILVAPTGEQSHLFMNACDPGSRTLANTDRLRAFPNANDQTEHFVAMTLPEGEWLAATASVSARTVDFTIRGQLDSQTPPRPMIDPHGWDELFQSAVFAVVERGGMLFEDRNTWPIKALGPLVDAMGPSAGEVVAAVIRENPQEAIEVSCAISTAGPESRAEKIDAGAAGSIAMLSSARGKGAWLHDFEGFAPKALRTAQIDDQFTLYWRYIGQGWQPGWVIAGTSLPAITEVGSTAEAQRSRMGVHVTLDGEGWESMPMTAWRSFGIARPARLAAILAKNKRSLPGLLSRLETIDSISWTIRDLPAGGIDGSIILVRSD